MTGAAPLDAERDELVAKRDRVAARLVGAKQNVAATKVTRDHLHASPNPNEDAVQRAVRAHYEALGEHDGLTDLHAEIVGQIAAIEAAIVERDARAERERVAAAHGILIDELHETAADVEAATLALAETYERLREAAYRAVPEGIDGPDALIGRVRESIMHRAFPLTFTSAANATETTPGREIASRVLGLRAQSAAVVEGTSNVFPLPVRYVPPPTFPDVAIALYRPGFYRGELGGRVALPVGGVTIPEPIAAEAIRQGVGFGAETTDGKAIIKAVLDQPGATIERNAQGRFVAVRFTGTLGTDGLGRGKGLPPAPPPADLGQLPTAVTLAEAAE